MSGIDKVGRVKAASRKYHSNLPVIVIGAGATASLVIQRIARILDLVHIEWGIVSDLPLITLLGYNIFQANPEQNRTTVKAADILDWSGQIGEFRLTVREINGEVRTIKGCAVILAMDGLSVPTCFQSIQGQSLHSFAKQMGVDLLNPLDPKISNGTEIVDIAKSTKIAILLGPGGLEALPATELVLKCALKLKADIGGPVQIFYRDMAVAGGELEKQYQKARELGVRFHRYTEAPQLISINGIYKLVYQDYFLPSHFPPVEIVVDRVILAEEYLPAPEFKHLAEMAGLSLNLEGFLEAEALPYWSGRTNRKGIYGIGMIRGPRRILDLLDEMEAVCLDLINHLTDSQLTLAAQVDPLDCEICLTCFRVCPHRAVEIRNYPAPLPQSKLNQQAAWIHPQACQGCGICLAECPAQAISWLNSAELLKLPDLHLIMLEDGRVYREQATSGDIQADNEPGPPVRLVALACANSGYPAAKNLSSTSPFYGSADSTDHDSIMNQKILAQVRVQNVPCAGQIDSLTVLNVLEGGADGVLIWSCHPEACNHLVGPERAKRRLPVTQGYLQETGWRERVALISLAGQSQFQLLDSIKKLSINIRGLGGGVVDHS